MSDCTVCDADVPSGDGRCWGCSKNTDDACKNCGRHDCKGCDKNGDGSK